MSDNIEAIAAGLTKARKDAIVEAVHVKHGNYPERYEVRARVWKAIVDAGLGFAGRSILSWGRGGLDRAILNERGLAVRAYLLAKETSHDA